MATERRNSLALPTAASETTRDHVLEAAEVLFIEHGYKGVSMKDVADAVGITAAALYYHFPAGKEELFSSTIRHFLARFLDPAFAAAQADGTFRERLTRFTDRLLSVPVDRLAPLLREAHQYLAPEKRRVGREVMRANADRVAELFQAAIDAGEITAKVPTEMVVAFHQGMCSAVLTRRHLRADDMPALDNEEAAKMIVATLLDGVA